MTPASFPSGVDVRSRHLARWAALGLMVVLVLAIPASQCRWTVDDPYLLDFARMTLREAHAEWMRLWGFERLQTPLLCHLQYPLGEGLCHLLRVAVHVACAALYGLLLVRLGWGSAVAVTSVFFWLFLPFQVEPVMLPNFQSLLSQPALLGSLLLFERGGAATATANGVRRRAVRHRAGVPQARLRAANAASAPSHDHRRKAGRGARRAAAGAAAGVVVSARPG
jgi:hypothetical protein